jgi:hypothetical protein
MEPTNLAEGGSMAIIKRKSSNPDTVLLTFQLPKNAWAETVHVVGDFNPNPFGGDNSVVET